MTGRETDRSQDRIFLRSQLSDMAQLSAWIESLVSWHAIPANVAFAINLCLEEAVSNVIRHGYGANKNGTVTVGFTTPRADVFVFIVEDEAQNFNPLDAPTLNPDGTARVGGQGINFLRQFANELEYEATPAGNRLRMGFSAASATH